VGERSPSTGADACVALAMTEQSHRGHTVTSHDFHGESPKNIIAIAVVAGAQPPGQHCPAASLPSPIETKARAQPGGVRARTCRGSLQGSPPRWPQCATRKFNIHRDREGTATWRSGWSGCSSPLAGWA
jgi:hypothetical protein